MKRDLRTLRAIREAIREEYKAAQSDNLKAMAEYMNAKENGREDVAERKREAMSAAHYYDELKDLFNDIDDICLSYGED